jgi:hypothetical protein
MKIPKRFKLAGQTIQVIIDKELQHREDLWGLTVYRENKILLDEAIARPQTGQEQTFLHELVHWILYAMESDLRTDEKFVNLFSNFLHQALTTMEYKE